MSHSDEAIALQLQLGEDSRWELKQIEFAGSRPRRPSRDDLADEIAAFANANGGALLCSVTDEGEVQGMLHEQIAELDSSPVEASSAFIRPTVRIRTYHKQLPDGRRLLPVDVPEIAIIRSGTRNNGVRIVELPGTANHCASRVRYEQGNHVNCPSLPAPAR